MRVIALRFSLAASLLLVLAFTGAVSTLSDSRKGKIKAGETDNPSTDKRALSRQPVSPLSYRSPGARHKLMLGEGEAELEKRLIASRGARKIRDYGSYTLLEVSDAALASLKAGELERAELRDDMNIIKLKRGQIDTTGPAPIVSDDLKQADSQLRSLHLVQLSGPPAPDSLRALKQTGAKIISYVPNNAYLLWVSPAQVARIRDLTSRGDLAQWDGPFHPAYKIDPRIKPDSIEQIPVSIELVDTPDSAAAVEQIKALSHKVLMREFKAAGTIHLKVYADSFKLPEVARMPEVIAVEPWARIELNDERANQIVAGALSEETINSTRITRPATPGFLAFLNSVGFNAGFDFVVDVGDTGFDRGSPEAGLLHPDFLDGAGASRIAYLNDYTFDAGFHPTDASVAPAHDALGHGTINASIIGGYNVGTGSAFEDSLGFQYGMGVAPFVRIGVSKIFDDEGGFGQDVTYRGFLSSAYRGGARITSNSWGACNTDIGYCNLYNDDARVFDAFVRDADLDAEGNQEMVIIFSSGNDGEFTASIDMPGTAKNIITVGASEGFRATDAAGNNLRDGCGVGATGADNAFDMADFSSGGPVQDGRYKPDLVAPGTHITGAASQDRFFEATPDDFLGVCDRYFPTGQKLYALSSGTSHAAPVVAGGAALAFQWLRARLGSEPSPALVKAFMLNSTSYLNGKLGGDSLPGSRQGWGLMNLNRMFEQTDRIIYDQSPDRLFTQSGGAPFETTGVISDAAKEFRVMLAWTDPPGNSALNAPYVNQLNLELIVGGVVYNANTFSGQYSTPGGQKDFLNNVQAIRLPAGTTGPFIIRVRPTIIAGDGVFGNGMDLDQDFALVVTNGRETPLPILAVAQAEGVSQNVVITHAGGLTDSSVVPGESALFTINVRNQSRATPAEITSAVLALPGGGSSSTAFPTIPANATVSNPSPFQMSIPRNVRCGSVLELQLRLGTAQGQVTLPIRVRVGRESIPGERTVLMDDDVDSSSVTWKFKKGFKVNDNVGNSGRSSYHSVDPGLERDDEQLSTMTLKKKISIPSNAGQVRLTFMHIFNFEPGFDGGVLEISTDNGATWADLGSRVIVGGYDGKVTSASDNPLGNRLAWTSRGVPGVFSQVVISLDDYAGQKIKLRFLAGFDGATGILDGYAGWFIDDIRITLSRFNCP